MTIVRLTAFAMAMMWLGCARTEPIQMKGLEDTRLSDGTCPTIHCDTYQSDALALRGPEAPTQTLGDDTIDHLWSSPIAGGILDYQYPDGTTVFWVSQVDRIMKLRLDGKNRLQKITELPLEPKKFPRFSPEDMQRVVAKLDATAVGTEEYDELAEEWNGYQIEGLRAYYAMVSNKGILYVSNRNGVVAYGDAEPGNPDSKIVKLGQYVFEKMKLQLRLKMPLPIMIGMNVTPDGRIIAVTIDGTVVAIEPDLSDAVYYTLTDEQIWNSIAVDENGGVYVPGTRKLHKLVWKDGQFSDDPKDGAWVEAYEIGSLDETLRAERGSGTTPALLGGPDEAEKFVVFADAANVNNLILYWRDEIPADWQQIPGTSSRRIAGLLPVNFGDPALDNSYSENSATIFDYGAVLANNQVKTNEKMWLDVQLKMKDPARTPSGIQKFQWDKEKREWKVAWTRPDVSSPNSTPVVTTENRQLHTVGLKDGVWTMQTLDWDTGETRAVYTLGESERYNPIMLALQVLPNGDPIFATFAGVMHLRIGRPSPAKGDAPKR
ncbi:MAG: hypothetical protein ACN4G0_07140 [Polyangiales bacterium]